MRYVAAAILVAISLAFGAEWPQRCHSEPVPIHRDEPKNLAVALAVCSAAGQETRRAGSSEPAARLGPPAEGAWEPIPELTDEFDGDRLDPAKWHDTNPAWKGRKPALFRASNVRVEGGSLHLTMRCEDVPGAPKGYHTFTSAAVKSRVTVRYGYFEVRARAMKSRGSSAFWFYRSTPERWTEIDVFEIGGAAPKHQRALHLNVHVFRTPTEKRHWSKAGTYTAPADLADAFHVYGLLWTKEQIAWTFDGRPVRTIKNTHWHQPLNMDFDSETMPKWFGLPEKKDLPSTFSIAYIRAWKQAAPAVSETPRPRTEQGASP